MKTRTALVLATLGALAALPLAAQADGTLIVPGRSIGQTRLGRHGDQDLRKLPRPDAGDAAAGRQDMVWVSKHEGRAPQTLYIHAVRNGALDVKPERGVTIEDIRVTSPTYHTAGGIHPGSARAEVRRRFPHARSVDGKKNELDDARRGIGFEFASAAPSARCIAISVHPRGSWFDKDAAFVKELLASGKP